MRRGDVYRFVRCEASSGSAHWADEVPEGEAVTLAWLASGASVPARCGMFLALCASAVDARTVLELGAGTGISSAYLAGSQTVERFVTIEGSPPLARLAAATIRSVHASGTVVQGAFEAELPRVLEQLWRDRRAIDLAYVDGHHDGPSTVRYVEVMRAHLRHGSLVVLDDIRLWREMWQAWRQLASSPGISAAVDTGRFGVLVVDGDAGVTPRQLDLARFTGRWRVGPPRPAALPALPRAACG
jgi:predicted O-methyltransferase YrrM